MFDLIPQMLTQAMYYLPSVLANFVVLGLAAWIHRRNQGAAVALGVGTLLQLLASLASFSCFGFTMMTIQEGWSVVDTSWMTGAIELVASLMHALGEIIVAAGVYLGVLGSGPRAPAVPEDPYGYKRA